MEDHAEICEKREDEMTLLDILPLLTSLETTTLTDQIVNRQYFPSAPTRENRGLVIHEGVGKALDVEIISAAGSVVFSYLGMAG